ncbi:MAG TPA: PAS domain S-box protein [Actinobacteria bacterium]|nr:PAS domain S-box protein [Actinomycetota bacterium]
MSRSVRASIEHRRLLGLRAVLFVFLGAVVALVGASGRPLAALGLFLGAVAVGALPLALPVAGRGRCLVVLFLVDLAIAFGLWWTPFESVGFVAAVAAVLIAASVLELRRAVVVGASAVGLELLRIALAGFRPDLFGESLEYVALDSTVRGIAIAVMFVGTVQTRRHLEATRGRATAARRRFRAVVEAAPMGVVVVEGDRVAYLNSAARRLLGVGPAVDGDAAEVLPAEVVAVLDEAGPDEPASVGPLELLGRLVEFRLVHRGEDAVDVLLSDVTDARREAEALRHAEHRFRTAFANAASPFLMSELDTTISEVNGAFARLVGRSAEELIGTSWQDLIHPDDRQKLLDLGRPLFEDPTATFAAEARMVDGERILWLEVSILEDADGRPARFFTLAHDITDQRAAEAALAASEARYRSLFERIPVALYRTRMDGEIVDANPALARLLGVDDPRELVGRNATEFYASPSEREAFVERVLEAGVAYGLEIRIVRPDGSERWLADSSRLVRHDDGEEFFEGALVDITARRQVERELRARARQREAIASIGQLALETADLQRLFLQAAEAVTAVLHLDASALVELADDGTFVVKAARGWPAGTRLVSRALVGLTIGSREPVVLRTPEEIRYVAPELTDAGFRSGVSVLVAGADRPFGALWVFDREVRVFSADDLNFLVAIANVLAAATDRHRARSRLEELVRSKDDFIAAVSHELRTPLTVVTGMAHELRDRWRELSPEEMTEFTRLLADQSIDVADLIEDLLVVARADIGKVSVRPIPVDAREQALAVVEALTRDGDRQVVVSGPAVKILADPVRLRQILRNLLTNAFRYGGPNVAVEIVDDDETVAIRVVDDGEGVPPERRDRIFEPYERAHDRAGQPGSVGLGLTVSRTLAELMGGTLVYAYEEGRSVFCLGLRRVGSDRGVGVRP